MILLLLLWSMTYLCNAEKNYFIDKRLNCNNVYGAIFHVNKSTEFVQFLGLLHNTDECIDSCLNKSTNSNPCQSYTYFSSLFTDIRMRNACYGRFGYKYALLWTPVIQENANCGRIIYKCLSDLDCSLNGKCSTLGNCTCNKAWSGYHCQQLNLLPATKGNGYHIVNDNNSGLPTSSWGGSVLVDTSNKSNKSTSYHMYLAEYDNHCGVNSWQINSVVSHVQSTNGYNSPFKRIEVIHKHFATEPIAIYSPNNQIVLYYAAFNYTGYQECNCSDGSTPPKCWEQSPISPPEQIINIMQYSENSFSFNGPWKTTVIFPNRSTNLSDINLAGIITSNGTFIGFSREVDIINKPSTKGSEIHLVTANNWKNGQSYIKHEDILFPQLSAPLTEDPFVYIDCNGYYHAIFHNMSPQNFLYNCGGHAFSINGIDWIYGGVSYGNSVEFTDGTYFNFTRRESPHLIFDQCTPIALTTGSEYGGEFGDACYTLLQPINH